MSVRVFPLFVSGKNKEEKGSQHTRKPALCFHGGSCSSFLPLPLHIGTSERLRQHRIYLVPHITLKIIQFFHSDGKPKTLIFLLFYFLLNRFSSHSIYTDYSVPYLYSSLFLPTALPSRYTHLSSEKMTSKRQQ